MLSTQKKHAVSTTCTTVWKKQKATKQDWLQRWNTQRRLFIHHSWQPLSISRQVWLGLCPNSSKPLQDTQAHFWIGNMPKQIWGCSLQHTKLSEVQSPQIQAYAKCDNNTHITNLLVTGQLEDLCDLAGSSLMQSPHLASHCPPSYKPRELPVLHCVKLYFFPFLFSWPFFQHPSSILRSELQRAPPTVPKMWPLLTKPPAQETALHSPPNISPTNNSMLLWACHITEGMQVDPEPWPTRDMQEYRYTCGLQTFTNTDKHATFW